jgi:uncharacterized membrane protein YbaN (DUF454 family)
VGSDPIRRPQDDTEKNILIESPVILRNRPQERLSLAGRVLPRVKDGRRMDLRPVSDPLRSLLYVAGGWLFVGLAVVGAVLPLVPSTPFLLLASWCFYRGSPRIHAWLHRSRHFGPMLDDWEHYHGVRRTTKRTAVLTILAVVATSLLLNSLPWWLRYVDLDGADAAGRRSPRSADHRPVTGQ